jgi:hypothetical protein
MRHAGVLALGAVAVLALTGCGGGSGGPVSYVASVPEYPHFDYADLLQWVPGHSGRLTGTLTSTSVRGPSLHALRVVTARYHFTGSIRRCTTPVGCPFPSGELVLTIRGWPTLPDFQTFGPLHGGTLKLDAVPQSDGNSPAGTFRRENAAAYNARVAALRREVRRADG